MDDVSKTTPNITISHGNTSWTMTAQEWVDLANAPVVHPDRMSGSKTTSKRAHFSVKELSVDAIAIKAAHGHPDYPVTGAEVDILLAEIDRLRKIEAAARVQHEAYGAYPGLVEALNQ